MTLKNVHHNEGRQFLFRLFDIECACVCVRCSYENRFSFFCFYTSFSFPPSVCLLSVSLIKFHTYIIQQVLEIIMRLFVTLHSHNTHTYTPKQTSSISSIFLLHSNSNNIRCLCVVLYRLLLVTLIINLKYFNIFLFFDLYMLFASYARFSSYFGGAMR